MASIHQEILLPASPARVSDMLLDSQQFSAFSGGGPAEIDAREGGAFSCFGGRIEGRTIELRPAKRIVQAWRVAGWPEGVYSIVRFELTADGAGTKLTMDHTGFPDGDREHLAAGWTKMYWDPLKKHLA